MEERRRGFTAEELQIVADNIATILEAKHTCSFSPEEQVSLRSLLKTKKWAATTMLVGIGTILLWVLKDVYEWVHRMVTWGQG